VASSCDERRVDSRIWVKAGRQDAREVRVRIERADHAERCEGSKCSRENDESATI